MSKFHFQRIIPSQYHYGRCHFTQITPQFVRDLISQGEQTLVDFKRSQYALGKEPEKAKAAFLKDMLAMANSTRDHDGYIVIGVADRTCKVLGETRHHDQGACQQFLNTHTNHPINFGYMSVELDGVLLGVYAISRDQKRPLFAVHDFGERDVHKHVVYRRTGSTTETVSPDELIAEALRKHLRPSRRQESAWSGEQGREIKAMVERWRVILAAHGVKEQWVPELFPSFDIPVECLIDWPDTARVLIPELREATCDLFFVRRAWLEEGCGPIQHHVHLDASMTSCRHVLEELMRTQRIPEILVIKSSRRELGTSYRQRGALLLRAACRRFGETEIYRYVPVYTLQDWRYEKSRLLAKLAMLGADWLGFEMRGWVLASRDIEALWGENEPAAAVIQRLTGSWNPLPYIYRTASSAALDPEELDVVVAMGKRSGFLAWVREARVRLGMSQPSDVASIDDHGE